MSAKSIVFQALSTDATIQSIVGLDSDSNVRVYQSWHDSLRGYPQITITRVAKVGESHGDNSQSVTGTPIQIDGWDHNSPTALENAIDSALRTIPENERSEITVIDDQYDTLDKVYRVILQITIYE